MFIVNKPSKIRAKEKVSLEKKRGLPLVLEIMK